MHVARCVFAVGVARHHPGGDVWHTSHLHAPARPCARAAFTDGNPLLVTMEGEFVAKNMALIAAALVVAAFARPAPTGLRPQAPGR